MLRGRTACSGQTLQMTLERPFTSNKYICANIDIKINWSTLCYCHELTERQHRKGACRKIVLPPSQHKNQSQTAGGWHSWDYMEARNTICNPNKKHLRLTSLRNHYNTSTFRLLISHDLAVISRVLLQTAVSYTQSAELPALLHHGGPCQLHTPAQIPDLSLTRCPPAPCSPRGANLKSRIVHTPGLKGFSKWVLDEKERSLHAIAFAQQENLSSST